ncbi:MAG: hypothetical protein ACXQS8_06380 [Candidatus Helarchaeales archaeon]
MRDSHLCEKCAFLLRDPFDSFKFRKIIFHSPNGLYKMACPDIVPKLMDEGLMTIGEVFSLFPSERQFKLSLEDGAEIYRPYNIYLRIGLSVEEVRALVDEKNDEEK